MPIKPKKKKLKIKRCPQCKGKARVLQSWHSGYFLKCTYCCFVMTHAYPTRAKAIRVWNDPENRRSS